MTVVGILQLKQIEKRLIDEWLPHIDLADLAQHGPDQQRKNGLSRALVAFAVSKLWEWDPEAAAAAVTDGSSDNGLDAIAVDLNGPRILIAQSKWNEGTGSMAKADMLLFKNGVEDLLHGRFDNFSAPIQARWQEIQIALQDPSVRIDLVVAHSGSGALAENVSAVIRPIVENLNEFEQVATFRYLGQEGLHGFLTQHATPIDLDVELSDWGVLEAPVRSFYGHVSAQSIAEWHDTHGDALFNSNIRSTLSHSAVNDAIYESIKTAPEKFWYYNNGVTILCSKFEKAPTNANDRRVGLFRFTGVQVVNGAQTVGSISRAMATKPQATPANADGGPEPTVDTPDARVMVRFIELEGAPDSFGSEVTRWTNTQNRVGGRDFLALDPEQERIAQEFAIDELKYVFRSGEADPLPDAGCGVQEATIALACANADMRIAVQAKREVSRLWADIEKSPYKALFNANTNKSVVWDAVRILRDTEQGLAVVRAGLTGKDQNFLVHLNRVVPWIVNQHVRARFKLSTANWADVAARVRESVDFAAPRLAALAVAEYPGYPANLAKNATECERLARIVLAELNSQFP